MAHLSIPVEDSANEVVVEHIKQLFQQAYEQGVQDGRTLFAYPEVLTKKHLCEIFQLKEDAINKMVANPTFPKFTQARARYPRDQVLVWIRKHTSYLNKEAI